MSISFLLTFSKKIEQIVHPYWINHHYSRWSYRRSFMSQFSLTSLSTPLSKKSHSPVWSFNSLKNLVVKIHSDAKHHPRCSLPSLAVCLFYNWLGWNISVYYSVTLPNEHLYFLLYADRTWSCSLSATTMKTVRWTPTGRHQSKSA